MNMISYKQKKLFIVDRQENHMSWDIFQMIENVGTNAIMATMWLDMKKWSKREK